MKDTLRAGIKVVTRQTCSRRLRTLPTRCARWRFARRPERWAPFGCWSRQPEPASLSGPLRNGSARYHGHRDSQPLAEALGAENLRQLKAGGRGFTVTCADFLECNGDLGEFDRVVMNPPLTTSAIKHIEHALIFLKYGGRLVAICAYGPRQREKLMPEATEWIDLPEGLFVAAGTNVNAAIVVIDR